MAALHEHHRPAEQRRGAYPGLLNYGTQNSYRTTGNSTLRSTLGANLVNELRGGWQWSPNDFFSNITPDHFTDQDGYALAFPIGTARPTYNTNPQPRNTTTWSVDNTLNWLRGAHSFSMGGGYAGVFNRAEQLQRRPEHHARLRHEHRSGRGNVQRHELPVGDHGDS